MRHSRLTALLIAYSSILITAPAGQDLRLTYRDFDGTVQPYRLYVPAGYAPNRPAPLVIALHGTKGDQNTFFEHPSYLQHPLTAAAEVHGALVLSPYGRGAKEYRGIGEHDVFAALAEVRKHYRIDPERIYVTGHSMGGTGAAYLAIHHPDLFAAAVPIAAAYGWPSLASNVRHVPVWWIAGDQDAPPFIFQTEEAVRAMREAGAPVRFTLLPGKDHYGAVSNLGQVVDWLLEYRRNPSPREYDFVADTPMHGTAYYTRVDEMAHPG